MDYDCVDCGALVTVTPRAPAKPRCTRCSNYFHAKKEVLKRRNQLRERDEKIQILESSHAELLEALKLLIEGGDLTGFGLRLAETAIKRAEEKKQ